MQEYTLHVDMVSNVSMIHQVYTSININIHALTIAAGIHGATIQEVRQQYETSRTAGKRDTGKKPDRQAHKTSGKGSLCAYNSTTPMRLKKQKPSTPRTR